MASGPGYAKSTDHTVVVTPATDRYVATLGDDIVAETNAALELREAGYPAVIYFPPESVKLEHFETSSSSTYCPFKGEAGYLAIDGRDVAWRYGEPYDEVSAIRGHIAFYAGRGIEVSRTS